MADGATAPARLVHHGQARRAVLSDDRADRPAVSVTVASMATVVVFAGVTRIWYVPAATLT